MYTKTLVTTMSHSFHMKKNFNLKLDNLSEQIDIDKIVKFASRYYIILCHDLSQYENRTITKKRIIGAWLFRFCSLVTGIRFLLSSMMHKKWMSVIMSDANYMISNQRLISMIFSIAAFVILFIGVLLQVNEMNGKFTLLDFLIAWKRKKLLGLSRRNAKRLIIMINMMSKLLMVQAFWPLVILNSALMVGPTILAYLDPQSGFMLIPSIFFSVCLFVWIVQFYCIVCAGFVAWSIPFFYLKFKFQELYEQIRWCVHCNDQTLLMNSISQHYSLAIQTKLIDDIFKFVVFALYYFGSPALMMLLYASQTTQTVAIARPICGFIVLLVYFVVFYLNLVSSRISYHAEKPRKLLHKYLFQHTMPFDTRFKIYKFIEKLSGSDIGFHCWDMFPMNSYTFYKYISSCAYSYLLVIGLYSKMS